MCERESESVRKKIKVRERKSVHGREKERKIGWRDRKEKCVRK